MAADISSPSFSSILQSLRKEKKVTQEQLATQLGVSPQAVSKWENGSYPEGDLIPKIADYFSVSIDYLYGRAKKETSFEQKTMDYFKDVIKKGIENGESLEGLPEYWETLYNLIWAAQISPWGANADYYMRKVSEVKSAKAASVTYNNMGYSYLNMDKDNEFYILMKQNSLDGGMAHWMKHSEDIRRLFSYLSSEDNVRVLLYLYSMGVDEYADLDTIAGATGVAADKVDRFITYILNDITKEDIWKHLLTKVKLATNDGGSKVAYGVDQNVAGLMFGLFAVADSLVRNPNGYSMLTGDRTVPWVDWNSVK